MELLSGLSAINAAIGIGKSVVQADHALDTATLKSKLADMMIELANAKLAQMDLIGKLEAASKEIERLLASEGEISNLKLINEYYFQTDDSGNAAGWPCCPKCLEIDKRISKLVQDGDEVSAKCPRCDTHFRPVTSFVAPGYSRQQEKRDKLSKQRNAANAAVQRHRGNWMS